MAAILVRTQSRVMFIDPADGVEKPKGLSNSNKSKKSQRIAKTALEEQVGPSLPSSTQAPAQPSSSLLNS